MAVSHYRSINKLINSINKNAKMASKTLAKAAEKYLKYKTEQNLYNDMPEGEYYERTGQFLNSITLRFNNVSGRYSLLFDGRKIKKEKGKRGNFNAHADFSFEKFPQSEYVNALEEGHFVPMGSPVKGYKRPGANMLSDTKEWLQSVMIQIGINLSNGMTITKSVKEATKF